MSPCQHLRIITPAYGQPYGRCLLMNNGENINDFLKIKGVIEKVTKGAVSPNEECPFFNREIDLSDCPCYHPE